MLHAVIQEHFPVQFRMVKWWLQRPSRPAASRMKWIESCAADATVTSAGAGSATLDS